MLPEQQGIQDINRISAAIEILSRSPHNRVLLRYTQIHSIIFQVLAQCSSILSIMENDNFNCYNTLSHMLRILNNFHPILNHCNWLTLVGPFQAVPSNVLPELDSVFGPLDW